LSELLDVSRNRCRYAAGGNHRQRLGAGSELPRERLSFKNPWRQARNQSIASTFRCSLDVHHVGATRPIDNQVRLEVPCFLTAANAPTCLAKCIGGKVLEFVSSAAALYWG
jgi:hypothetical protein